ncbi:MAG TPA: hypothetical protein VNK81_00445 [Thermodesulfobacteriota bacterium]|nr:hypothetical protein [Thermodesulfobacteriota bacterium]
MKRRTEVSVRRGIRGFIFLVLIPLILACVEHKDRVIDNERNAKSAQQIGLTLEALQNAEYHSEYFKDGRVRLTNGEYGGVDRRIVISLADAVGFGDLNGDGVGDAAVVLVTSAGGSVFYDLAVVINEGGTPKNVASTFLGDRIKIDSVSVEAQRVIVNVITHDADDPTCCPTLKIAKVYHLENGTLVENGI